MSGDDKYADLSRLPLDVAAGIRWAFQRCAEVLDDRAESHAVHGWPLGLREANECRLAIAADLAARDRKREGGA